MRVSHATSKSTGIGHLPALDGLRGLALIGVLLFHANGVLTGGYLGVDLFFVLSGYLITALLLAEKSATGRIALREFWIRRARRLFPALLSLMPAIAVYALVFARRDELAGIRGDALATLGYVANWRAILSHKSYLELFVAPSPLEHTWSLCIEEQFYLVWPVIVAVVLRLLGRRGLAAISILLAVLSIAAMVVLFDPLKTSRAYYGTDTRATAILAGALLAMVMRPKPVFSRATVRAIDVVGLGAAIGLAMAWWTIDGNDTFLYRGGFWLTEIAAVMLIVCAVAGSQSMVARALSIRPLRFMGAISYGAYLWHWPLHVTLTAERTHLPELPLELLRFALTIGIAWASYRFFEQPIRKHGIPFGRPVWTIPASVGVAVMAVLVGTRAKALPPPPAPAPPPIAQAPIRFRLRLLGDSTANALGWTLMGLRDPGIAVELKGRDGFTLVSDGAEAPRWTLDDTVDATVVVLAGAFLYGFHVKGAWQKPCAPRWDTAFENALASRLADLESSQKRVWIASVPYALGPYESASFRREIDCVNQTIRTVVSAQPQMRLLDLAEILCPKGACQRESDGVAVRPDGVHFDIQGARPFAVVVLKQLEESASSHVAPSASTQLFRAWR